MNILLAELAAERLARGRRSCSSFTFRGTPITVVEEHGRCLGSSAWASSFHLARHLEAGDSLSDMPTGRGDERFTCIELGAGVGLPGICASFLGGQVILTDKEEALMIARANVDANSLSQHVQVGRLDWGDASSPLAVPYHLVLAADVVYSPDVYGLLNDSLMRCTRPGSLVLLAYRQRNVSDGTFFTLLAQSFSIELAWCSHASPPPAIAEVLGLHGTAECKVTGEWVSTEATAILRMLRLG